MRIFNHTMFASGLTPCFFLFLAARLRSLHTRIKAVAKPRWPLSTKRTKCCLTQSCGNASTMATILTTRCKARADHQEDIHSRSSSSRRRAVGSSSAQAVEEGLVASRSISKVAAGEWVQNYAVMIRTWPSSSLYLLRIPLHYYILYVLVILIPAYCLLNASSTEKDHVAMARLLLLKQWSRAHTSPSPSLARRSLLCILISSESSTDQSGFDGAWLESVSN